MNCSEFEQLLDDVADRRQSLETEPEITAHARECAACACRLAAYQRLEKMVPLILKSAKHTWSSTWSDRDARRLERKRAAMLPRTGVSRHQWWGNAAAICLTLLTMSLFATWPFYRFHGHLDVVQNTSRSIPLPISPETRREPEPMLNIDHGIFGEGVPFAIDEWVNLVRVDDDSAAVLRSCYRITSELPGMRTLEDTVNAAWTILLRQLSNERDVEPRRPESPSNPHTSGIPFSPRVDSV